MLSGLRICVLWLGIAGLGGVPAWGQQQLVIPAGQERLLGAMVGQGDVVLAGCRLRRAAVQKGYVIVEYACPGAEAPVRLVMHPPTYTGEAAAKTEKFVLAAGPGATLPPGLADAVAERIRAGERRWYWLEVEGEINAHVPIEPTAPLPPEKAAPDAELDPELVALFERGLKLYGDKRHGEALALFVELAAKNPRFAGALGMIVANLAPTHPDAEGVRAYTAKADAAPDDLLAQFMAGVAAHYSAHYTARTPEQKRTLYETSIRYLERTRPAFDFEPRTFIYLAVSHYRLGHQEQAEALIEEAVRIGDQDPDAYYCRAEIMHRNKTERALTDLDKYLEMTEKFRAAGGWIAESKVDRVKAMQAHLRRVMAGEEKLDDIFDPLASDTPTGEPPHGSPDAAPLAEAPPVPAAPLPVEVLVRSPKRYGQLVLLSALGFGLLLAAGWWLWRRKGARPS
jgi:tetratricopeptide (TPR) repeat protein